MSGADGTGAFSPPPGTYDVEVVPPAGTALVGDARRRVDLTADGARAEVSVAIAPSGALRATVFEDSDADGVRDAGEGVASGWSVTLTGSSTVPPVTTGATGTAEFSGLRAGSWALSVAPRSGWRTTTGEVQATVGAARAEVAIGVSRRPGFTVRPVDDSDGNGVAGSGERTVGGLVVEAAPEGAATIRSRTDDEGTTVDPGSRPSKVRVLRPDNGMPWQCTKASVVTTAGSASVACDADGWLSVPADALEVVAVGPFPEGIVTTRLFDDADRDGTQDPGEAPLADWPVALVTADTRTEVMRTTSDSTGVAGLVAAPGSYEVVPMPPTAEVPWVSTKGTYAVKLARAGQVAVSGGWVQPGSVSVGIFHDLDQDGTREAGEVPLADRSVSLLDGATGAVVATQLSDGTGRAAFPAKAGTTYRVSVELPTGWRATSPLSNGTVQSSPSVTAPADGGQATVEVGHYNTVDRTPPAAPTLGIASGALTAVTLVPITAETGATIRYTLDGTAPTASRGMLYSTPVRVSRDRVLRAVAVDAAGNTSAQAVASYTLPWTGKPTDLSPTSWSVTSGGAPRGGTVETASDDGRYLLGRLGTRGLAPDGRRDGHDDGARGDALRGLGQRLHVAALDHAGHQAAGPVLGRLDVDVARGGDDDRGARRVQGRRRPRRGGEARRRRRQAAHAVHRGPGQAVRPGRRPRRGDPGEPPMSAAVVRPRSGQDQHRPPGLADTARPRGGSSWRLRPPRGFCWWCSRRSGRCRRRAVAHGSARERRRGLGWARVDRVLSAARPQHAMPGMGSDDDPVAEGERRVSVEVTLQADGRSRCASRCTTSPCASQAAGTALRRTARCCPSRRCRRGPACPESWSSTSRGTPPSACCRTATAATHGAAPARGGGLGAGTVRDRVGHREP